jgi:hypothetical protein
MSLNDLIKIFVVWTPEAILNLIIVLLIAGLKDKLKLNKLENLIRFASVVVCMVLSSVFIVPLVNKVFPDTNIVISFLLHTVAYAIIFFAIYTVDFQKAFLSVLLMGFTFATLENIYYPFLVAYVSHGYQSYNNNISQYVLFSCITRIVQVILIAFLWDNQYIFLVTKLNKKLYNIFSIFISLLAICELYVSVMYSACFGQMSFENQITYGIVLIVMIILFYVLIYKIIYSTIRTIIVQGYKQYQVLEKGAQEAFKSVYSLLEGNDIESAKAYVAVLIGGEENKKI